jgi:hypothetical protein
VSGVQEAGVAEVLVQYSDPIQAGGVTYLARACGAVAGDNLWQGWIEFTPDDGGPVLRSARETTQPNRDDAIYWATGLTPVYLEGSLQRTLTRRARAAPVEVAPAFDRPEPDTIERPAPAESVLDPFSVYQKGEDLLRRQLGALSPWHLVNIVRAHGLSTLDPSELNALTGPALVELIVSAVRRLSSRS